MGGPNSAVNQLMPFKKADNTAFDARHNANTEAITNLQAAQSDPNVDPATKAELAKGLAEAGTSQDDRSNSPGQSAALDELLRQLSAAKAGVGIYGVRKVNADQLNLISASPGRTAYTNTPTPNSSGGNLGGSGALGSFF